MLVALGANLAGHMDSPSGQLDAAIREIDKAGLEVKRKSRLFRTPCFPPPGAGPDFVNAAIICESDLSPRAILKLLHGVEISMGRQRVQRWAARVLDLDLLAVGDQVLPDADTFRHWAGLELSAQMARAPEELILPHPRLHERGFVLVPLLDIAPDWRHPVLGKTVAQMHAALDPAQLHEISALSQ